MSICSSNSSRTVIPKSDNINITSNNTIIHIDSSKVSFTQSPEKTIPDIIHVPPDKILYDSKSRPITPISEISYTSHSSVNRYPKTTLSLKTGSDSSSDSSLKDDKDKDKEKILSLVVETPKSCNLKPKLILVPGLDEITRILSEYVSFIQISVENLACIINDIKDNYHNYPYHNLKHALIFTFNQLQFCHYNHDILVKKFSEYNIDISYNKFFILFILSGFAHDIGHIGLTNAQLRDMNHPWAIANNNSPAEHFHATTFLKILSNHNILLSDKEKLIFYEIILATSLEIPHTIFNNFTIFKYIMRFSDLSHWCSNLKVHHEWYKRLLREINHRNSMYFDFFEEIQLDTKNASNQQQFSQTFFEIISYLNSNIPENDFMLSINKKFSDNISFWNDKIKSGESFFI
jgi:hypothetical protein